MTYTSHIDRYEELRKKVAVAKLRRKAMYKIAETEQEYCKPSIHDLCLQSDDELYMALAEIGWFWADHWESF